MYRKKKVSSLLLILLLTLSILVGCGSTEDTTGDGQELVKVEDVTTSAPIDEPVQDSEPEVHIDGELEVHFIDVGQGDAVLIRQGEHDMLVDGGDNGYGNLVVSYLKAQGVSHLDYVIGTHPHADHIGGLDDVINTFSIGKVIMPEVTHNSITFEDVIDAIKSKGLKITKPIVGDKYAIGDGEFTIIGPSGNEYSNVNDYSVMMRLVFGENSFMLTGDAEKKPEGEAIATGETLKSDVLKAGHHGSETSTTDSFLEAVDPDFAVIQVGEGNRYDHPSKSTLTKLQKKGIETYRNDLDGNIIASSNGKNIRFNVTPTQKVVVVNEPVQEKKPVKEKEPVKESAPVSGGYVANVNSKVLHKSSCGHLPDEKNRVYFDSTDEALASGYKACKVCKP